MNADFSMTRRPWRRALGLAAGLVGLAATATAQTPSAVARLGQSVLKLGDETAVVVTALNTRSARLVELPRVDGLELGPVLGPSTYEGRSIVGGRVTVERTVSWTVEVRASAEGEYELPPFTVEVDGQRYTTEPLDLTVRADLRGAELGFIELRGLTERLVEGQPLELELAFGWDRSIAETTNFADLRLPWIDGLPGALLEKLPNRGARREQELLLNRRGRIAVAEVADELVGGKPYRTFSVRFELVPVRSGRLAFPASFLQFGTLQGGGFFDDARLVRSYFAKAPEFALDVEPLPTANQPFDFTGAIGTLEARASADVRDVQVGDSIKLTVEWIGAGNLDYFEPPDPSRQPGFEDFRFFGTTGEKLPGRRRVVYDLAPLAPTVTEIPPLELPVFDTEAWDYVRVATEAIPIRVRPLDGEGLADDERPRFAEDLRDIRATAIVAGGAASSAPALGTVGGALAGMLLTWVALRSAVRQGGRNPSSIDERRRRRALRSLERELRASLDPETDLRAWGAFLAARTADDPEAWIGRDPREVFGPDGERPLPPDAVDAIARLGSDLEAAVFGDGERVPRQELIATARDLLGDGL